MKVEYVNISKEESTITFMPKEEDIFVNDVVEIKVPNGGCHYFEVQSVCADLEKCPIATAKEIGLWARHLRYSRSRARDVIGSEVTILVDKRKIDYVLHQNEH